VSTETLPGARFASAVSEAAERVGIIAATKLQAPVRRALVPREALVAELTAAPDSRLTLLSAPPGSGKTTLLGQWLSASAERRPFAWLSLDEEDDDPVRFWTCVIQALRTVEPGAGTAAAGALVAPGARLVEVVVPLLVNELVSWPRPAVLVLDDYHLVHRHEIHESLAYLLDHLPDTLRVAIATRADPPLPLGRLRARAQLTEIGPTCASPTSRRSRSSTCAWACT
jgi:LuxR family transcriptional regulator, maltose regulon positive regulatory protein